MTSQRLHRSGEHAVTWKSQFPQNSVIRSCIFGKYVRSLDYDGLVSMTGQFLKTHTVPLTHDKGSSEISCWCTSKQRHAAVTDAGTSDSSTALAAPSGREFRDVEDEELQNEGTERGFSIFGFTHVPATDVWHSLLECSSHSKRCTGVPEWQSRLLRTVTVGIGST